MHHAVKQTINAIVQLRNNADEMNKRLDFESKLISTVSLCEECKSSKNWLGNFSPKEKIGKSGLWLVNELWKTPLSNEEIGELKNIIIFCKAVLFFQ